MVEFAPEYYREVKHFYSKTFMKEMFDRNSIPVNFYSLVPPFTEEYQWGSLPGDNVQKQMDAVYMDEPDPYIEELQGRTREYQDEKYFGRDYTSVENVHCVFTTEAAREGNLTRFGHEVTERLEAVIFLHNQVKPKRGDYFQVPLHQEYDEMLKQTDGRVLPGDPIYILYMVLEAKPEPSGMLFVVIAERRDKPTEEEKLIIS